MRFEPPYESLSHFVCGDVQVARNAQDYIDLITPVVEGKKPHVSTDGNAWWLEVGPATTRMGDIFVTPPFELEVSTRWLVDMLTAFRDEARAFARRRREAEGK